MSVLPKAREDELKARLRLMWMCDWPHVGNCYASLLDEPETTLEEVLEAVEAVRATSSSG